MADTDDRQLKIKNVMAEGAKFGKTLLQNALRKAGVELTGDLINSVTEFTAGLSSQYEPEITWEFRDYMRYKDMSKLTYLGYTNTDAIIKFVQKVGVESFAYVSGSDKDPTQIANAESKIAWAILKHRKGGMTVTQQANRRVYNKTKMIIFNKIRRDIQAINAAEAFTVTKHILQ